MSALPIEQDHDRPTTVPVRETDATRLQARRVREALEHAVESGRLRPFEAIECAAHYCVELQPWVQEKHDYYTKTNRVKS